jgi:hypothetical protein
MFFDVEETGVKYIKGLKGVKIKIQRSYGGKT